MSTVNYWDRARRGRWSRRSMIRAGGAAGAGLAGAALLGCGDDDATDDGGTPTPTPAANGTPAPNGNGNGNGEPRSGGTFSMNSPTVGDNFNMVTNGNASLHLEGSHVYDRPISSRPDERIYELEAAEEVEIPDDTTVIFRLKEGLVYQDIDPVNGREVTSEDIVTLHEYVMEEGNAHNPSFQNNSLESMETPDERTVVFNLRAPNAYLFSSAQLGYSGNNCIIPQELVTGDFDQAFPVGSGPYQLDEYQFGVRHEYVRNPTYRRADEGLPYIDRRVRIVLTDASALEAAFRSGQNEVWVPTVEAADRLVSDMADEINVEEFFTFSAFTWNVSSKRSDYDDERVREAFYRIFNAEEYIELVAQGWAEEVPGVLPASHEEYQLDWSEVEEYKRHDPDEAVALLEAAGFDFDQQRLVSSISGAVNESAIQVFAEQLRRIGISNLDYEMLPLGEWHPRHAATGDYDFCVVGHPAEDTPHRPMRLNHSNTGMVHDSLNLADPEVDDLIERSEQEMDRDEHVELVKEAQRLLLQKYGHMHYIYTAINRELRYNYIRDWEFNGAAQVMYRPEAWLDA